MLTLLAGVILYALGTFGAVLPHSWLLIAITWLIGSGGMFLFRALKRRSLDFRIGIFILFGGLLIAFAPIKVAVGLFAVGWSWLATEGDSGRALKLLRFLILIGILESLLGLIQYFVSPGWVLGYHNERYISSGTLINRNHFAGLLEMLIPLSVALSYLNLRCGEFERFYIYLFSSVFIALAVVFSLSRMGMFSTLMGFLLMLALMRIATATRKASTVFGFVMFGLLSAGVLWVGIDSVSSRFGELPLELEGGRLFVFRDTLQMIAANPLGVGAGKFSDVFRQYQRSRNHLLYDHTHNDYLETASEWGVPVAIGFWTLVGFAFFRTMRGSVFAISPRVQAVLIGCAGSIFSILVHSMADFNLQIPSNAIVFFAIIGVAQSVLPGTTPPKAPK